MSHAFHDFIGPGDHELYAALDESLRIDLAAAGSDDLSKTRLAVDRARDQAHRLLHDRQYRNETSEAGTDLPDFGLADYREIRKGLDAKFRADFRPPSSFCKTQAAA